MKNISSQRLKLLFRKYFIENWRTDTILVSIVAAIFMLINIDAVSYFPQTTFLVICMILASRTFLDLGSKQKSITYLTIPASTGEKVIVNSVISLIYYPAITFAAICVGVWLSSLTSFAIGAMFSTDTTFVFHNISLENVSLSSVSIFYLICSVMMFGSVFFRKNALIYTTLCILGFLVVALIVLLIFSLSSNFSTILGLGNISSAFTICFCCAGIIFFVALTYLRLKETEA